MPSLDPKLLRLMPEMPKFEDSHGYKKYILIGIVALAAVGFLWWQRGVPDHADDQNQASQEVKKTVQEEINAIMNASGNQPASTTQQEQEKIQKEITAIMDAPGNKPAPQTPAHQQAVQSEIERIMNAPGN